jgi:4-oxalocrotonate tautomerase
MPVIQISLVEGRDEESIKRCIKEVARTVHQTLGAPLSTIRVVVQQVPPSHWGVGDQTRDEIDAARAADAADAAGK